MKKYYKSVKPVIFFFCKIHLFLLKSCWKTLTICLSERVVYSSVSKYLRKRPKISIAYPVYLNFIIYVYHRFQSRHNFQDISIPCFCRWRKYQRRRHLNIPSNWASLSCTRKISSTKKFLCQNQRQLQQLLNKMSKAPCMDLIKYVEFLCQFRTQFSARYIGYTILFHGMPTVKMIMDE